MGDIYHAFSTESSFASAVGWVFKYRMHQLLAAGRTIEMYPIRGNVATVDIIYKDYAATKNRKDVQHFELEKSDENILPDPKTAPLKENVYYRPKSKNFPGIDSWFLYKDGDETPIILMFQITSVKTAHGVKSDGLGEIDSLKLPQDFLDARRIYVVITPDGIEPQITVPIDYFKPIAANDLSPDALEVYHRLLSTKFFRVEVAIATTPSPVCLYICMSF